MALKSNLFRGDRALDACLVKDSAHIKQGSRGLHVEKIQAALIDLDNSTIARAELSGKIYGPQTAAAVLAYKQKRKIINRAYQAEADNIVGRMTVAAMDQELISKQEFLIFGGERRCRRPVKTIRE